MNMKRAGAVLLALLLALLLCACGARADFSAQPKLPEDGFFSDDPPAEEEVEVPAVDNDEMAEYAWELYSAAIEKDAAIESYDVTYAGEFTMAGQTTRSNARLMRVAEAESVEMLVQTDEMQGYLKDSVGYFQTETDQYWFFTDEDGFMTELGFSDSPILTEKMFADALVIDNGDGTRTVSCPLDGEYAAAYAEEMLGNAGMGLTVTRVEVGVTVDEDGAPLIFTSLVEAEGMYYGEITAQSSNTYTATGADVTITPPANLDSYRDGNR